MSEKELRKEVDWIRNQSRKVTIDLPDREPDEPPATEAQIRHINRNRKALDEEAINKLGTKQAAALIDQMKIEAANLVIDLVDQRIGKKNSNVNVITFILVLIFLYILFLLLA